MMKTSMYLQRVLYGFGIGGDAVFEYRQEATDKAAARECHLESLDIRIKKITATKKISKESNDQLFAMQPAQSKLVKV